MYKEMKRAVAVFLDSHELTSCYEWSVFARKVPTKQKCEEERHASPQNSDLQDVHSRQISDVILAVILNKLPYEYEFENPVKIFSAQVRAEVIHSCVRVPKNPASFVRALEKSSSRLFKLSPQIPTSSRVAFLV